MSTTEHAVDEMTLDGFGPPAKPLRIPVPKDGGLIVLRGLNDLGKSEALKVIDNMLGGPSKPSVTRGALRGSADGFGVTLKVSAGKAKRSGELCVESLEGRFSLDDLIQPQIKDPIAADKKRIEVLLQVTGIEPSAELFHSLIGSREDFDKVVGKAAIESDDVVLMASRIKADIETAAQHEESQRDIADTRARSARQSSDGVDTSKEADQAKLANELEAAIRHEAKLKAERTATASAEAARKLASVDLENAESDYRGLSVDDAATAEDEVERKRIAAANAVDELTRRLADAKQQLELAAKDRDAANRVRVDAERHEAVVEKWRAQVTATIPPGPSAEDVIEATEAVRVAREAVEQGAVVRRAQDQLAIAAKFAKEAALHAKRATKYREAAAGVKEVLSGLVSQCGTPLRVEDGRLLIDRESLSEFGLDHGRHGPVYYAELSHGTRSLLAADIAVKSLGQGGACVMRQEFYEGMSPRIKAAFATRVHGKGVKFYTAQATDDEEIRADVIGGAE